MDNLQVFMLNKLQFPQSYPVVESSTAFCDCLKISVGGNSPHLNWMFCNEDCPNRSAYKGPVLNTDVIVGGCH